MIQNDFSGMTINRQDRARGVIVKVALTTSEEIESGRMTENSRQKRQNGPVLFSGWLHKMKRRASGRGGAVLISQWNKRWVTIENDCVLWRHSADVVDQVAGSILLEHILSVYKMRSLRRSSKGGRNREDEGDVKFVIKSRKRVLCLMAKNSAGCDKWVRALQLQLDLRSGGTASGPPCNKNRRKSEGGGDKFELMIQAAEQSVSGLSGIIQDPPSLGVEPSGEMSPLMRNTG